jgi:hypothetical protein
MSSETPEIVLNEFGDLSRKAKRELLARGIDPETAVVEHLRTASIPIIRATDAPPGAPESAVPPASPPPPAAPLPSASTLAPEPAPPSSPVAPQFAPLTEDSHPRFTPWTELATTQPVSPQNQDGPVLERRRDRRRNLANLSDDVQLDYPVVTAPVFADPETEPEAVRIADLRQAAEGSDLEPFSMATTASTGVITSTSHALILPTLPEDTGNIVPLLPTGETLITGAIILPSTLGQLGADAQSLDTSEVDVIEDEHEVAPSQDLAPVSATLAVSSYNTSTSVVTVPRKMGDRLPLILAVTAAVLAVGVVALFVAGYFLRIF